MSEARNVVFETTFGQQVKVSTAASAENVDEVRVACWPNNGAYRMLGSAM